MWLRQAQSFLNALNYTVPNTLPIGRYQFRVQARSAFGELSSWSETMDFQVVGGPTLLGPASSTFSTRPSFSWASMSGTVGGSESVVPVYDFRLDVDPAKQCGAGELPHSVGADIDRRIPFRLLCQSVGIEQCCWLEPSDTTSNYSNVVEFYVGGNPVVNRNRFHNRHYADNLVEIRRRCFGLPDLHCSGFQPDRCLSCSRPELDRCHSHRRRLWRRVSIERGCEQ
jgi:hypothetical protein